MTRPRPARHPRAFTLIELMIVMAIIGLLSSIAVPMFRAFSMRAKASERDMMTRAIYLAITDEYRTSEHFTNVFGNLSYTWALPNPPQAVTGNKRPFDKNVYGWRSLSVEPEGAGLYGQYEVFALTWPGLSYFYIHSKMDLDSNGIPREIYTYYQLGTDGSWYEWMKADPLPAEW